MMQTETAHRRRWPGALVAGLLLLGVPLTAAAQQEATLGQWSTLQTWPNSTTHTHLLPNGKVLFWGEYDGGYLPYIWDPASGNLSQAAAPAFNPFCGGHTLLPSGRLLEVGGHVAVHIGYADAAIYDPATDAWTELAKMNAGRWYPTATSLPNGDVFVISGEMAGPGDIDTLSEVYQLSTGTWRELTGAQLRVPFYPREFVAPDGRIFIAGTQPQSYWFDPTGAGSLELGPKTLLGLERSYGGGVMYDVGKILLVGGGVQPTASAEVIDLNAPSATWRSVAPMSQPRRQHNSTLLPDGTVLVNGGSSSGATFNDPNGWVPYAELWDPATERWTKLAAEAEFRGYHSTGLLLPDGRVLTGGGRGPQYSSSQIYSPPYLFKGERPTIDGAPDQIWPNAQFFVKTASAADIARVSLVRLGSVTHSFNTSQRYVPLESTASGANGQGLVVTGPKDNNVAPTGTYMLFLVDSQGVPSIGKMVNVVYGPTAGPAPAFNIPVADSIGVATAKPTPAPSPKAKGGCGSAAGGPMPLLAAIVALALVCRRHRRRASPAVGN